MTETPDELGETFETALLTAAPDSTETTEEVLGASQDNALPKPRTRWAAILWGALFAALAGYGVWFAADPDHLDGMVSFARTVSIQTLVGYGALALGVLVLMIGLVALARRGQSSLSDRRSGL